jgi:hypothetical protein
MNWIKVEDKLPESGQEVLTYYFDKPFELDQINLLTYFKKGAVTDSAPLHPDIDNPEERLLDAIFGGRKIKAKEDGFYLCEDGWRKHADVITHWMPLPEVPKD